MNPHQLHYLYGLFKEHSERQSLPNASENARVITPNIPFGNYVGRSLRGRQHEYQIEPRCWDDGDLVIFPAVSQDGDLCEAQFFKKCQLPRKLYLSRKRRIQRLKRSTNFMDELDQEDAKILVSRVPQGSAWTRWK